MKVSRTMRRVFSPLLKTDGPAKLDLRGVSEHAATMAIRGAASGDLVRCLDDGPNPLASSYVFTAGSRAIFLPWTTRLREAIRAAFWWYRPFT